MLAFFIYHHANKNPALNRLGFLLNIIGSQKLLNIVGSSYLLNIVGSPFIKHSGVGPSIWSKILAARKFLQDIFCRAIPTINCVRKFLQNVPTTFFSAVQLFSKNLTYLFFWSNLYFFNRLLQI